MSDDRIPSIGITKAEWTRWSEQNNRPYTDPYRHHHTPGLGPIKSQAEYEIRAKIPRKKKEKTNA